MVLHNGNLTQIGPWFLGGGGDFPFLNFVKQMAELKAGDNTTKYDPSQHDSNGYPTSIYGGGGYGTTEIPGLTDRPGDYIFEWAGDGEFFLGNPGTSYTSVSGSLTGLNGKKQITPLNTSRRIQVTGVGSPHPTNWRFYHADDEALLAGGGIFGTRFLDLVSQVGVIRHLDWQKANESNVVNWADRTPVGFYSYLATQYPASKYAGVTANTGDAYTVAKSGFTLTDKAQVIVKFNATSTGTEPTINVEGTGDIVIRNWYGIELGSTEKPATDYVGCLTYEERLGCYLKVGGDTARKDCGIISGVPPEIMIELARQTGTHPYFVSPYLTVDPLSDYMPGLAQLCKDTLNA